MTRLRASEPTVPGSARGLHRFFVEPELLGGARAVAAGESVALVGAQAHQISRVLRLRTSDRLVLVDGAGHDYIVRLAEVRSSTVTGTVELVQHSRPEPRLLLTLYQALVPRDRFETVLQKGTEIGIGRFVPTWCERSIVAGERIDEKRLERWRRIVTEAAEQCERGIVPEIASPVRFDAAVAEAVRTGPLLVAWEREQGRSMQAGLRDALGQTPTGSHDAHAARQSLGLMIGPEGGFAPAEIAAAREAGAITVSLGPRILRTETAGPILAALALYHAGDLEPAGRGGDRGAFDQGAASPAPTDADRPES